VAARVLTSPEDTVPTLPSKDGDALPQRPLAPKPRFSKRSFVQQFEVDRTCSEKDCETKLSRYNGDLTCSVHNEDRRR
jgi:hypothetical protein